MPTKTWAASGGDFLTTNVNTYSSGSSTASASPAWDAACAAWVLTNLENGDTGTVNMAGDGGAGPGVSFANMSVLMQLENDGSISGAETCNTVRLVFDWNITNGPMGTATAESAFNSTVDGTDDPHGSGASSGTYDKTIDGATLGTPTMGDLFAAAGDPGGVVGIGLIHNCLYTAGVFSAHNRRLAVSNLVWHIDYGSAPVVTDVSPSHGDAAGGTVVTLTGTGLDTGTNAFFNGTAATDYQASSSTSATCISPAHAVGTVTVTVA